MVAPIANMVEAALASRRSPNQAPTTTVPPAGGEADQAEQGGNHAARRIEDHQFTAGSGGLHLCAAEHPRAGAGQHRVDGAPVRAGGRGGSAGLGDLGNSGRSAEGRAGFKELVARVCLGEVGAIFGLEVSRLARSSADLAKLLELARLTETLVVDTDGIYDLADFNDRILLGLKGQMSEAELHILAGRLQGAKRAAAARGELHFPLPVGYVYDDEGATVMDPTRRSTPRWLTCSPPSRPPARPTRLSGRSPSVGSPSAPTAGPGPASCAGDG